MKTIATFCRVCEPSCGLVAQVETVEIAQRHDRAAQAFGQWLAVVEEPHAAYSRARSSVTKL